MRKYFLAVCLNPTLQRTVTVSRLVPGERAEADPSVVDIAGKGVNPTRIIQQLGEDACHLTQLGGSRLDLFLDLVAEDELKVSYVPSETEIRYCYTFLSHEDHSTTEVVEPGDRVDEAVERDVLSQYRQMLSSAHTVIVAGSKAPGFSDQLYPTMVADAKERDARVIVDFRGDDLRNSLDKGIDILKINVSEFSETFLPENPFPEDVPTDELPPVFWQHLRATHQRYGMRIVLTNGSREILVVDKGDVARVKPIPVKPVNTIGCGDAVTAGIGVGLHRGMSLLDAVQLGAECAARNAALLRPGRIE